MKTKLTKGILLILSLLCILCVPVTPVYAVQQGTDGSELQVVKAEQLEIQLGTSMCQSQQYDSSPCSAPGAWRQAASCLLHRVMI